MIIDIKTGIENRVIREVTRDDTASALGYEHMPVLATSRIVAFMEYVSLSSVQEYLPKGYTTVGSYINLHHTKPAVPGDKLSCFSKLTEVKGRKLTFEITLSNDIEKIAHASHVRVIINQSVFERLINKNDVNR